MVCDIHSLKSHCSRPLALLHDSVPNSQLTVPILHFPCSHLEDVQHDTPSRVECDAHIAPPEDRTAESAEHDNVPLASVAAHTHAEPDTQVIAEESSTEPRAQSADDHQSLCTPSAPSMSSTAERLQAPDHPPPNQDKQCETLAQPSNQRSVDTVGATGQPATPNTLADDHRSPSTASSPSGASTVPAPIASACSETPAQSPTQQSVAMESTREQLVSADAHESPSAVSSPLRSNPADGPQAPGPKKAKQKTPARTFKRMAVDMASPQADVFSSGRRGTRQHPATPDKIVPRTTTQPGLSTLSTLGKKGKVQAPTRRSPRGDRYPVSFFSPLPFSVNLARAHGFTV